MNQVVTKNWVIDLALQRSLLALIQVCLNINLLSIRVNQFHLLAIFLDWRHLQCPAQAVGQGEGRLHAPTIGKVDVVKGNRTLVECWRERRI